MYKNKADDGRLNLCGRKVALLRRQMQPKVSQRAFADMLQLAGLDLDKNAVQRMESGQRFVTDIELKILAQVLRVSADELLAKRALAQDARRSDPFSPTRAFPFLCRLHLGKKAASPWGKQPFCSFGGADLPVQAARPLACAGRYRLSCCRSLGTG